MISLQPIDYGSNCRSDVPRSWQTVEFTVRPATQALVIELDRRPSGRFDNKISGSLRVYQISLRHLDKP